MKKYSAMDADGNVWCVKDYGFQVNAYCGKRAIVGMDRKTFNRRFLNETLRRHNEDRRRED